MVMLKILNPFARILYGRISNVYVTTSGEKARLEQKAPN
jgi:hypothetical protein